MSKVPAKQQEDSWSWGRQTFQTLQRSWEEAFSLAN